MINTNDQNYNLFRIHTNFLIFLQEEEEQTNDTY